MCKIIITIILIFGMASCGQNSNAKQNSEVSANDIQNEKIIKAIENNDISELTSIFEEGDINVNNIIEAEVGNDMELQVSMTPLMYASYLGNYEIVRYLVEEKKADINIENEYGWTALKYASDEGRLEIVKYLVENGASVDAEVLTITKNLEVFEYLLEQGNLNINSVGYLGMTALSLASIEYGNLEMIKYLLEKGADINVKNEDGSTALMTASMYGNLEIIKYLIENGADINAKDNDGSTALIYASKWGNLETVEYLVKNGADINIKDIENKTALDWAANSRIEEVLKKAASK